MYGQFDPKWLYIFCVLGFEVGSAVCGAAPSMNALIIGRAVAGLAGAGMYLGVIMLLSVFTTQAERPIYFAMLGGTFGLGTVFASPPLSPVQSLPCEVASTENRIQSRAYRWRRVRGQQCYLALGVLYQSVHWRSLCSYLSPVPPLAGPTPWRDSWIALP